MPSDLNNRSAFQFGAFRVEPTRNVLIREGQDHAVEPRVMDVLCGLADGGREVTSRQALIDRIWAVEFGADEGLTRAVSVLRRVIRDAGETDTYIETIPKRGYRLLHEVEVIEEDPEPPTLSADPAAFARRTVFSPRWLAAIPVLLLAIAAFAGLRGGPETDDFSETVAASAEDSVHSIAVLPFTPFSDQPADLYFGDGVAEELLHLLAQIPDLHVAARTSSFAFREGAATAMEIGETLSVGHIVEGSVRRADDRIRITVQLIRVSDGFHLWSETFDRELTNIFDTQDEITRKIARALQIRLGVGVARNLQVPSSINASAVEHYYRGIYQWSNRYMGKDGFRAPFDSLRQAVTIEPNFAEAWAAIGYFGTIADAGPMANNRESHTRMTVEALQRAVSIDPENWLAHVGLGRWHIESDIDVDKALYHRDRALAIAPNALETLSLHAKIGWVLGDVNNALSTLREARMLDPINSSLNIGYAMTLAEAGQFLEAFEIIDACQQTNCAEAGFVAYATWAAQMSGDPQILERWEDFGREFLSVLERLPPSKKPKHTQLLPAVFAVWFDDPDKDELIIEATAILRNQQLTDGISYWAPTLSHYLPTDMMLDLLTLAQERHDLLSSAFAMHPFMSEQTFPDTILQHPRYHALWGQPGLSELAAARRAAGWTQGLPH